MFISRSMYSSINEKVYGTKKRPSFSFVALQCILGTGTLIENQMNVMKEVDIFWTVFVQWHIAVTTIGKESHNTMFL